MVCRRGVVDAVAVEEEAVAEADQLSHAVSL